ncbi:MAG: succinate dehydrogenase, hydrophobic membrane anchor protein [Granulosicoccus sp.]|nr:succinate dehydrogenase, hydrophobic membrane anchor protein [Granulosicoccus sp.]
MTQYQTPLSRVKGLGSAKEGTDHFWAQRLSALALIPLVIWLAFSIASLPGMDYLAIREWLSQPLNAILMILFMLAGFNHARLGLQVVVEDYIGSHGPRTAAIIAITFVSVALAVTGIFSVSRIAFAS